MQEFVAVPLVQARCYKVQIRRSAPSFEDGEGLMLAVMKHPLEGVVSKRKSGPYAAGSRPEWVKVKSPMWRQANKDAGS